MVRSEEEEWAWDRRARDLEGVRDLKEEETESPRCCPWLGGSDLSRLAQSHAHTLSLADFSSQIGRTKFLYAGIYLPWPGVLVFLC